MPSLGADMTEGTVTRWLVKPGDPVRRGDIVVEIETDKADMEVEIFETGTIEQILVPQGERVAVGTPLALVTPAGAAAAVPAPPAPAPTPAPAAGAPAPAPPGARATPTAKVLARELGIDLAAVPGTGVGGVVTRADVEHAAARRAPTPPPVIAAPPPPRRLLVSPRARRIAQERGIDLATVQGTGPGGSITAADLDHLAPPAAPPMPPAAPAEPTPEALKRIQSRKPISALMERANREIPHYYLGIDVDMSRALAWLREENRRRPVTDRILYSALLLKATAVAAHDVPEVNGHYTENGFEPSSTVNLGVAISLRAGGLVAPAILDASNKPLGDLMRDLADLVKRARAGRLRASEMASSTLTVTNLGELGVDFVYGVIYPPQVALVGFGRVVEKPWAEGGMLGARPVITATLAADHRVSDGHRGGVFVATINRLLQEPEHL